MHPETYYLISFRMDIPHPVIENAIIKDHPLRWLVEVRNQAVRKFEEDKKNFESAKSGPDQAPPTVPFLARWVLLHWTEISEELYREFQNNPTIMKL